MREISAINEVKLKTIIRQIGKHEITDDLYEFLLPIFSELDFVHFGIEKRLLGDSNSDFACMLSREKADLPIFRIPNRNRFVQDIAITKLFKLLNMLNSDEAMIGINNLWLEFDQNKKITSKIRVPGVYLQIYPSNIPAVDKRIFKVINALISESDFDFLFHRNLLHILAKSNVAIQLIYIGVFLGRDARKIRLAFGVHLAQVYEFVSPYGIKPEIIKILSTIGQFSNPMTTVHLDITSDGGIFQGIEIYADNEFQWTKILSTLEHHGWSDKKNSNIALDWITGETYPKENALKKGQECKFSINHIKFVNTDRKLAKIYLKVHFKG